MTTPVQYFIFYSTHEQRTPVLSVVDSSGFFFVGLLLRDQRNFSVWRSNVTRKKRVTPPSQWLAALANKHDVYDFFFFTSHLSINLKKCSETTTMTMATTILPYQFGSILGSTGAPIDYRGTMDAHTRVVFSGKAQLDIYGISLACRGTTTRQGVDGIRWVPNCRFPPHRHWVVVRYRVNV